jgi:hypothetical protein
MLRPAERALFAALLAGPRGRVELSEQARTVRVIAECSCGCPSVGLECAGAAPLLEIEPAESPTGDSRYYSLTGHATNVDGQEVQVTLQVANGRLHELEIWSGAEGGVELPPAATLRLCTDE